MFRKRLTLCIAALCFSYSTWSYAQVDDAATEAAPEEAPPASPVAEPIAEKAQPVSKTMPEFKFQYRFGLNYNDDGLKKDSKTDEPYTSLGLDVFRLLMDGKIGSNLSYSLRLKLEGSDPRNLDYGYVTWKMSNDHSISMGRMKVRDYGWEHRSSSVFTLAQSRGLELRPYKYEDLVALEGKHGWGTVTLQIAKDVVQPCASAVPPTCQSWNRVNAKGEVIQDQPALFFEYVGDFGGFKPLLQYGSYDQNHSNIATVGVKYEANQLNVELDYTSHNIGAKGMKTGSTKFENLVSTETNIAFNAAYKVNEWKPFLHYSIYDMDQFRNAGVAETKVNSAIGKFDDNATTIGLGAEYFLKEKAFRPFFAWIQKSGKFNDKNGKEATMAENEVKLGVQGEF